METNKVGLVFLLSVAGIGRKTIEKIFFQLEKLEISLDEMLTKKLYLHTDFGLQEKQIYALDKQRDLFQPTDYYQKILQKDIRVICQSDDEYPHLLKPLDDKPVVLYAKGRIFRQDECCIGVVGSRKMTSYGNRATRYLVADLAMNNCTIVSGFMYGIDTCAHEVAIEHGGKTVGVLGYGFDYIFPSSHKTMFINLLEAGATFFSEFNPEFPPLASNFPVRNRIVAGMTAATVVVEAGIRSGSLITAHYAMEYGRLVGAVAGPFDNPYSEGTKQLIQDGAKLVTNASDILEEVQSTFKAHKPSYTKQMQQLNQEERVLYEKIESSSVIDDIAQEMQISIIDLQVQLSILEMKGVIKRVGNRVEKVS